MEYHYEKDTRFLQRPNRIGQKLAAIHIDFYNFSKILSMNKVFQICLFLTWSYAALMAQKPAPKQPSTNSKIPEKWKNESVVIINQNLTFGYYKLGVPYDVCTETIERSLRLNDKSAVEFFSEFYFCELAVDAKIREKAENTTRDPAIIHISIVKPSGQRIKVVIKDPISVEPGAVPEFFRCVGFNSNYIVDGLSFKPISREYRKIAIPNLNIGDVLEYKNEIEYVAEDLAYSGAPIITVFGDYCKAFPAYHKTLAGKYPIMKQKVEFMLSSGFYLNMNSYNGAPDFGIKQSGLDRVGKASNSITTYQLIDGQRDRLPVIMMASPVTSLPAIKFQVVIKNQNTAPTKGEVFNGSRDVPYKTVTPEDVAQEFNRSFRSEWSNVEIKTLSNYIKKYDLPAKPFGERVKAIYSYVKGQWFGYVTPTNRNGYYWYFAREHNPMPNFRFAIYMSRCFYELGIKHEILAVMPRNIGKIKDLLLGNETQWVVRAEEGDKSIYLYKPSKYMTSDENTEAYLYGGEGYAFTPSTKKDASYNATARKVVVPAPDPSVSTWRATIKANFDDQLEKLSVNRTVAVTGGLKTNRTPFSSIDIDIGAIYRRKSSPFNAKEIAEMETPKKLNKQEQKARDKDLIDLDVLKKSLFEIQKKFFKKALEEDYDDIDVYDTFQVLEPGIAEDSSTLVYNEQFKLNNLIAKAGRNYTIEIGKMLSKEPKLDDDDLKPRETDIEISFPRTLVNEVELTLPEGYTIEDLKDLNFVADNNLMHYEAAATLTARKLSVKTIKIYKVVSAPKAEFPKIIEIFQKSYDFSQKKVVLKKL
jgi:hypothetical protein